MKSILVIVGVICSIYSSNAQITKRELPPKQKQEKIFKTHLYDSTFYIKVDNVKDFQKYKGQIIYILPPSTKEINYYYDGLCSQENLHLGILSMHSAYVSNKYLTIIDTGNGEDWVFKLRMDNGDEIYYTMPDNLYDEIICAPFIFPKYLEKAKIKYINKTFVVNTSIKANDANNGSEIFLVKNERWVCVDITLVNIETEKIYVPMLVFRNSVGNEIFVNYASYYINNYRTKSMTDWQYNSTHYLYKSNLVFEDCFTKLEEFQVSEKQKLVEQRQKSMEQKQKSEEQKIRLQEIENRKKTINQKFGEYYGNLINNKKVEIGMTKEMCLLSLGSPILKNVTTTEQGKYEVWTYLFFYSNLYFENNSLKIIKQYEIREKDKL